MIAINDFRQFISELTAAASRDSGVEVSCTRLAVTESQLAVLMKDKTGVVVCGKVPDVTVSYPHSHYHSDNECLLMVLEKMPRDRQNQEQEFDAYERLQRLMSAMLRLLTGEQFQEFCDQGELDHSQPLHVEWEYNTLGGWNGLSVVFHLKDKNGTGL